ncbi:Ldh family oxidoreductase [Demetria terragena]|uniref:Ldh family oxidoreductase n=1 Tax=Demetria terragena TaxID=63959 RepID=UPI000362D915|nr:Ldh family oxidoreductase [Demetria terragena]
MGEVQRSVQEWRATSERALVRAGARPLEAAVQTDVLIEAELRGHPSHGLQRLPTLIERMANGVLTPGQDPDHVWVGSAAARVDGRGGFGPVAARRAVELLVERAEVEPCVVATVANSGHVGMVGLYAEQLAEAGLLGVVLSTSEPLIGAPGGRAAIVGSNPIGIGVPSTPGPFVLDMSTAQVSMGKVLHHRLTGRPLGPNWAMDGRGEATTDPHEATALRAFGGGKGLGLALAFELLVGLLSGTGLGEEVAGTLDTDRPSTKGDLLIALDPTPFVGEGWRHRSSDYLDAVRSSAAGTDPVLVPGDRARRSREQVMARGIAVSTELAATVTALANEKDPS